MGKYSNYTKFARDSRSAERDEKIVIDSSNMYRSREALTISTLGGTFGDLLKQASEKKSKRR